MLCNQYCEMSLNTGPRLSQSWEGLAVVTQGPEGRRMESYMDDDDFGPLHQAPSNVFRTKCSYVIRSEST